MSRVVHTNIWSAYGYARKAGYEGTEDDFEQGLKKSAEAAENAEESASTASEAATEAEAARDAAAQSAESASTSEGNALEYANSAAQVLRDAQAVAQTVNAKANEAAGSASRAENYAQTATTKASEATAAAGTATAAATSASGSAQAADASATAAAASETNAAASASSASTSAGSASESAAAAQAVKDSIPADYTALSDEVTDLKSQISASKIITEESVIPERTHTNKAIYTSGGNIVSGGVTGSTVKVFPVTPGETYSITRNNAPVSYGFANTNPGNNTLSEGAINQPSTVSIVAPEGYIYLYVQDINNGHPDGICSVQHVTTSASALQEEVAPLVNNIFSVLNRVRGKYICHLGVNKNNNIIIPCQSLSDVARAKRLGFNAIEINVRQTSDGKYVCLHGSSGAFGQQFTDLNGDSVQDIQVSSMTLQQIKNTIRYKSNYERYRTAPYTLQEMLYECRKLDMLPLVEWQSAYTDEIEIIDSIMGKNNYLIGSYTYDRSDIGSDAPMYSFLTTSDADAIVTKCKRSGGAYVACLNVTNAIFDNFTIDDWRTLISAIHSAGYMVASAYGSERLNQALLNSGFDIINSTGRNINEIDNPNVYNLIDSVNYDGFTTDGTIDSGVMTLTNGDTVSPAETAQSVFLGGASMHIRFSGTIKLVMGAISEEIISNGSSESWFTSFYEEQTPTFAITAVGNVKIYGLSFKASKM